MKKIFLLSATAALFAACASNEDITSEEMQNKEGAVLFSAYSQRATRGDAASTNPITESAGLANAGGFGVFAFNQGVLNWTNYSATNTYPDFFNNQQVWYEDLAGNTGKAGTETSHMDKDATLTNTKWVYSPIKYYNNNDGARHSFFVYAPYQENVKSVFSYQGPAVRYNATENYDLMWATPYLDVRKEAVDQRLSFNFQHALSKVKFEVTAFTEKIHGAAHNSGAALDANTKIYLRSVKFVGNVPTQGLLSLKTGEWTIENADNNAYEFVKNGTIELTSTNTANFSSYVPVSSDNMVIPSLSNQKVKIQVIYDVVTTDGDNPQNSYSKTQIIESQEDFAIVKGIAYDFKLDLGLTSAKFTATAVNWTATDPTDTNVDLPNNNEFHRIGVPITVGAIPTIATNLTIDATLPAATDGSDNDFFYNTATKKMHKKAAGAWEGKYATAGAYFSAADGDLYVVASEGNVTAINPEVVVNSTSYYARGAWNNAIITSEPATIYSLNVNSEGKILTGGPDASVASNWTTVSVNTYYLYDGVLYLWKVASH